MPDSSMANDIVLEWPSESLITTRPMSVTYDVQPPGRDIGGTTRENLDYDVGTAIIAPRCRLIDW